MTLPPLISTGTLMMPFVTCQYRKRSIAFTHKPVLGDNAVALENRCLIAEAIKAGFMVNLSADMC